MKEIKFTIIFVLLQTTFLFSQQDRPNVIVILADDLGWGDVGYHGSTIKTPVIDRLAEEGIRLNRFYTTPICSPTRAGLMTGRYPDRFGLRETVIPPWSEFGVSTEEVFLPEYLAKAGYKNSAVIGKWHLGHSALRYHPLNRGFTHFYGHLNGAINYFTHKRGGESDWHNDFEASYDKGYATDLLAAEAVKNISQYSKEGPFFMYLAFNAPHGPFHAKKKDLMKYSEEEDLKKRTYSAMVSNLDENIGKVLEALNTLNIAENTIVLFFSDNGYAPDSSGSSGGLRGSKFTEWEGGVRAPAIIRWPAGLKGGQVLEEVTGYIDVLPTLLDIVAFEGELKNPLDGISIYPALKDSGTDLQRDFYLGCGAVVNKDWKLIEAGHNSRMDLKEDLLFNISRDVFETKDLKDSETEVYIALKAKLQTYKSIKSSEQVPPYDQGREGFVPPKEWSVEDK